MERETSIEKLKAKIRSKQLKIAEKETEIRLLKKVIKTEAYIIGNDLIHKKMIPTWVMKNINELLKLYNIKYLRDL